jgi:glycosyltransferase involved in cell wall biosynthesis
VYGTPLTYLPIQYWNRRLGKQHYLAVKSKVERNPVNFDIIHSHFSWTAGYVGSMLSDLLDIPNVITIHENTSWLTSELESGNSAIYSAWRSADALIRVNKFDCKKLSEYNNSIHYIPNGFSRDRYPISDMTDARTKLGLEQDLIVIFTLSSLSPRKNVSMLIEAVRELDCDKRVYCAIGGQGEEMARLKSKIQDQESIELLGYVPEDRLHLWMNACNIFTLTSNAEGNPTVMFEALGCGKPYIGTDVGGVSEIICSEEYGLLSPPGNKDLFRSNLQAAINKDWDREKIRNYSEQYTWDEITREVRSVLQMVLD